MQEKEVLVTKEGLDKMNDELEFLKTYKRQEVSERIRQAIEFGDISENSEYEDAKNEQAFTEGKIMTLEKMLRNIRLIEEQHIDLHRVSLGCKVGIEDTKTKERFYYTIVGTAEANPLDNKISNESPVGRSMMGKKIGEKFDVTSPDGKMKFKILSIAK